MFQDTLINHIQSKFIKLFCYLLKNVLLKLCIFSEYLENLIAIEKGIKEIEQLVESYYSDNRTAYVFTSDHGMTDWGKIFKFNS